MTGIPAVRRRVLRDEPPRADGEFVLYWMTANRRLDWNFALERAAELARELGRPLLILEALRVDYRWAADRHHQFILDGMRDHAARLKGARVGYYPYVEPAPGAGKGLLAALAERACAVVADDSPTFFLPRMLRAAARRIGGRLEAVDSYGLLPLRATERVFTTAHSFRRALHKLLPEHLGAFPRPHPLTGAPFARFKRIPPEVAGRWQPAWDLLEGGVEALRDLPIDHAVPPVPYDGGATAGGRRLEVFLARQLRRYAEERNEPAAEATSGLSPYLHYGQVSVHDVLDQLREAERWSPDRLAPKPTGSREGWWGMSRPAEAFLDELVTWREVGANMAYHEPAYDTWESLPEWARETLTEHEEDPRPAVYELDAFEEAGTEDPLWNAAQRQLRSEGVIHNYLRMLWGKKVLHWTADPRTALDVMIHLNDRWAVDGRDPNSVSGIFWCLGRYDRPWGPERPIFGKVRYMTSDSTRRKFNLGPYLERWGTDGQG